MSTSLKSAPAREDGTGADRRRSLRKPHVAEAWVASPTATRPDDRLEVTALNLSRHGVAFEVPKALPEGSFYVVEIGVGDQRLSSEIRIISCRKVEGIYEVGAEFC
jgi:hypothetical protein